MSIAEKLTLIARNVQKVFDSGKKAESNEFWDNYLKNGKLENYSCAFAGQGWTVETFKPNRKIKPKNSYMMFGQQSGAIVHQSDCPVEIDFSESANMQYVFYTNDNVLTLGVIDASKATIITGLFGNSKNLQSIQELIFTENTGKQSASNPFQNCTKLEHVIFSGDIACTGIDLHWSTGLDIESLRSLLTALVKENANGKTITLASNHESLIENDSEAKAQLEAAKAGRWTIAYN